jgi:phage tail tape-measure protein
VAAPVGNATWQTGKWATGKIFNRGQGAGFPGGLPSTGGFGGMMKLPLPVYIVNKRMSLTADEMTGGDSSSPAKKKRAPRRAGRFARGVERVAQTGRSIGRKIATPKGAGAVGAVIEGAMLVPTLMADDVSNADKVKATGGAVGGAGGAWAGAAVGAAIGTAVLPVIGTALGGLLGGLLGGFGGDWLGTLAAEKINSALDVKVTVDGPPGTTANVSNIKATGTELNADVYTGAGMIMP